MYTLLIDLVEDWIFVNVLIRRISSSKRIVRYNNRSNCSWDFMRAKEVQQKSYFFRAILVHRYRWCSMWSLMGRRIWSSYIYLGLWKQFSSRVPHQLLSRRLKKAYHRMPEVTHAYRALKCKRASLCAWNDTSVPHAEIYTSVRGHSIYRKYKLVIISVRRSVSWKGPPWKFVWEIWTIRPIGCENRSSIGTVKGERTLYGRSQRCIQSKAL